MTTASLIFNHQAFRNLQLLLNLQVFNFLIIINHKKLFFRNFSIIASNSSHQSSIIVVFNLILFSISVILIATHSLALVPFILISFLAHSLDNSCVAINHNFSLFLNFNLIFLFIYVCVVLRRIVFAPLNLLFVLIYVFSLPLTYPLHPHILDSKRMDDKPLNFVRTNLNQVGSCGR